MVCRQRKRSPGQARIPRLAGPLDVGDEMHFRTQRRVWLPAAGAIIWPAVRSSRLVAPMVRGVRAMSR